MNALIKAVESDRLRRPRRLALDALSLTYRLRLVVWPVRTELPTLLNQRHLLGCGAEVGVAKGDFSEHILARWHGRCLLSIDPWREVSEREYADVTNAPQAAQDVAYAETQQRLERFGTRSLIWRLTSAEAAQRLPNGTLDFVYIDARHDYHSVTADLETWFEKVRPGGVMAGHDFFDGTIEQGTYGVKSAVQDFFGPRGLRIAPTFAEMSWRSWLVLLPNR